MGIRVYSVAAPSYPDVEVTLTPINPPIIIPASGGNFSFTVDLANHEAAAQTFDAWIMVQLPNQSWYGPVLGPLELTIPAGISLSRTRQQTVPGNTPAGNYVYEARVGVHPDTIWDSDNFSFTKSDSGDGSQINGWSNLGEPFPGEQPGSGQPAGFDLLAVSPNPFNPATTISFELRSAGHVSLYVYDMSGRQVGALVDGWRAAGVHEIRFANAGLSSGIYFCCLKSGDQTVIRKMALLK
jgi:hypothetical protein